MTEHIVSFDPSVFLAILTPEQLADYIRLNPDKAEAIHAMKAKMEAEAKLQQAKQDFLDLLNTIELPDPPEGTLNIYNSFITEVRPLTDDERAEVKASNPNITDDVLDARRVNTGNKVWKGWEFNKAMTTAKASEGKGKARHHTITVKKIEGDSLVPVGNFRTGEEACKYLGLDKGKDSAPRYLVAKGYIVQDYEGDQFTVPEK